MRTPLLALKFNFHPRPFALKYGCSKRPEQDLDVTEDDRRRRWQGKYRGECLLVKD